MTKDLQATPGQAQAVDSRVEAAPGSPKREDTHVLGSGRPPSWAQGKAGETVRKQIVEERLAHADLQASRNPRPLLRLPGASP